MSAVKVGDRVRATCGESVIVGEVKYVYPESVSVAVDGDEGMYYMADGVWTVEVLALPIHDVVGTIVRDCQGDAWQRQKDAWYLAGRDDTAYFLDRLQLFGPLTVLWTPEATP